VSCLSCALDGSGKVECFSCRPDYSLFVTLTKSNYCERRSILSYCASNFSM
jgi:hypothetical protein